MLGHLKTILKIIEYFNIINAQYLLGSDNFISGSDSSRKDKILEKVEEKFQ